MKAIIIGAGRGSRLRHLTDDIPKTMVQVLGRSMLDQILDALEHAGFERRDIVFISGYRADVVKKAHPELTFVDNEEWESNNILLSLEKARAFMSEGFVSTYADIIYTREVAKRVAESAHDFALGCDTAWRARYTKRSEHPETDAEKLVARGGRITKLSRRIASDEATGEFIGVMKLSRTAAQRLLGEFDSAADEFKSGEFREGRTFQKAYLIDLLARMLERGEDLRSVDTPGGYMEIDTLQDESLAAEWRAAWPAGQN